MYQTTIQPFWVVTQCRVCRNVPRSLRTQPRSGFLIVIVIATPKTLPRRIARVWHRSTVIMKLCCFEMRPCVQIFLHDRSIECCKCKMWHLSFDWGHGPKYRFELNCNVWVQWISGYSVHHTRGSTGRASSCIYWPNLLYNTRKIEGLVRSKIFSRIDPGQFGSNRKCVYLPP